MRLCLLDGNPFQQALREIAAVTTLRYALNVVVDDGARSPWWQAATRPPPSAPGAWPGAAWVRRHEQPFDLVVAGVPAPKDRSLYQASRAATYVGMAARPVLVPRRPDRLLRRPALGVGDGPGELNFGALLAGPERPIDLVARGRVEPLGPGGQRAYMMAKLMLRYRVALVGDGDRALIEGMGLLAFRRSTKPSPPHAARAAPRPACWPWPTASTPSSSSAAKRPAAGARRRPDRRPAPARAVVRAVGTGGNKPKGLEARSSRVPIRGGAWGQASR